MPTVREIAAFANGLPEDARVVLVVQRGPRHLILRTDSLETPGQPSWPRAVWDGIAVAGQPAQSADEALEEWTATSEQ